MDFNSNKKDNRFGTPLYDVPVVKTKAYEEDDDWLDLRTKVSPDKPKSKKKSFFKKKKPSAFDGNSVDKLDSETKRSFRIPTRRTTTKKPVKKVELSLKLTVPKIKVPKNLSELKKLAIQSKAKALRTKVYRDKRLFTAVIAVLLIFVAGSVMLINSNANRNKGATTLGDNTSQGGSVGPDGKVVNDLPREKPTYKILYPGKKNADNIGEIVRISPSSSAAVYTYVDKLGDVQINVSQQELPDRFKQNQDGELEKLATSFQQKDVIQVDSIKVFHGKTEKGVQSLIFIKGNLLITIRASQPISDDTWAAYISALHS